MDKNIIPLISKCDYNAIIISDHAPLSATLQLPTSQTPYQPWRFNNQWLAEKEFVKYISREITLFLKTNRTPGMSNSIIWESLKAYLRGQIISYGSRKNKNTRKYKKNNRGYS